MASIVEVAHATDGAPGKLAAPAPVARAMMPEWSDKEKAKIRRVFDECDTDHSGTVSFAEITRGLAKDKELARILGIPKEAATASGVEDLKAIFVGLDVDASGELDFDEFGLFFAERVEILRYLPGADDDDKFCVMTESAAHLSPTLTASFESNLAAVEPKVDGLAAGMLAQLPAAVKHFLELSVLLKDARAQGKSLAAAGLTQASLDAYAAAMLSALADALGEDAFTAAHAEAYGKCVHNLCDMYRLGAEDAKKMEREIKAAAIDAAKAKLAAEKLAAQEAVVAVRVALELLGDQVVLGAELDLQGPRLDLLAGLHLVRQLRRDGSGRERVSCCCWFDDGGSRRCRRGPRSGAEARVGSGIARAPRRAPRRARGARRVPPNDPRRRPPWARHPTQQTSTRPHPLAGPNERHRADRPRGRAGPARERPARGRRGRSDGEARRARAA